MSNHLADQLLTIDRLGPLLHCPHTIRKCICPDCRHESSFGTQVFMLPKTHLTNIYEQETLKVDSMHVRD